jgi:hypothetical protein
MLLDTVIQLLDEIYDLNRQIYAEDYKKHQNGLILDTILDLLDENYSLKRRFYVSVDNEEVLKRAIKSLTTEKQILVKKLECENN